MAARIRKCPNCGSIQYLSQQVRERGCSICRFPVADDMRVAMRNAVRSCAAVLLPGRSPIVWGGSR